MITTLLTGILASGLLLSASISHSPTVPADTTPSFTFTQVLPETEFVAYPVQKGETLETIAHTQYEDAAYWKTLWNDNQWIQDPNDLKPGLLLQLRVEKPVTPDELIAKLTTDVSESLVEAEIAVVSPTPIVEQVAAPTVVIPTAIPVATNTVSATVTAPVAMEDVYKEAGEKYGVPWQILYGLHMTESGGRDGAISSGRGPQGPMQFMPGTWKAYGVDGNGDGNADINSAVDAVHGAANYLAKHGSLDQGLRSYGGNTAGTLSLAREKGFTQ